MSSRLELEKWLGIAAWLAALIASVAWVFVPAYGDGVTVAEENGSYVYGLLLIPPAVATLPLLAQASKHAATVISAWVLTLFCFITGFTIGYFYWPSALLMLLAAYVGARTNRRRKQAA
jgi:hypothetical protein